MKSYGKRRLPVIILTGLSGAGKTVVLNALEDSSYFCVDNIPASLIKTFIHLCQKTPDISRIAIGIDVRERKFYAEFADTVSSLRRTWDIEILFLEAQENVLIRRFKETRRPHPLGGRDIRKAIRREVRMLSDIKAESDRIIDTSPMTPHQLRKMITRLYVGEKEKPITVSLVSFGYKYGIPAEADLLFDVRFLPNPNFIKELKPFDGTTLKVKNFVLRKEDTKRFLDRLYPLLEFLIPKYKDEGRHNITIGIGCTGGKHRSPAISEEVRKTLKKQKYDVSVAHRDI
ncbi:MAG TPA: RNase adapter RapZ [Nitrospirae bacterium]|nr:glmZ(sRNA)-inactivating NTPase [bacterium BMS3Abin10]GBE38385.1 glmZ(sRNA)-inactivating NTPase [bacterium BMS3Bbin08]HDH51108.1 RNase adapter RapZ [Nitrospirota bacterium]HDK17166.1 RNase adapter RapZ [Nitrospirota bacterium]HDK41086.1 RNase adapter RapZ [Nitrospirota bacterium]